MVLPAITNFASVYVLNFLSGHERDEAEKFFDEDDLKHLSPDLPATISLDTASRSFTITVSLIGGATNKSVWTFERPGTIIKDLREVKGTIYKAAHSPPLLGDNQFWIQQYPSNVPGEVGRTVIEFYTDRVITAVFKTNNDNYGASGDGNWSIPGPRS